MDYRINEYLKNKENKSEEKNTSQSKEIEKTPGTKSISKEIRRNSQGGHEPLIHKPVFTKINSQLNEMFNKKKSEEETIRQAQNAAKTGVWYGNKKSAHAVTSQDVKDAAKKLTQGGLVKTSRDGQNESDNIYRRVAKFLLVIGQDEAAKILPHLEQEQIEKIIPEIASIQKVSPQEAEAVLEEFSGLIERSREEGGVDTAKNILYKAFGKEKGDLFFESAVKNDSHKKPFDYLEGIDPERIKILIGDESLQIQALVLSQLEAKQAALVINKMDAEQKKNIVLRLAKMQSVSPEVLDSIDKTLHEKLLNQNTENSQNLDGRGALAQILKRMDPGTEQSIIETLSEQDPDLGADLRNRLFTEEDFISADDKFIQNKLRAMSDEDLAYLIAGKNDLFRKKILSNVSKTRAQTVLSEEEYHKPMRRSDCEKITSQFYSALRRAWENGELIVKTKDEGEIYV